MNKVIKHYGTPRHSGRYPWGSGRDPQRSKDFLSYLDDLKKKGVSDVDIAKSMEVSTTRLRTAVTNALAARKKGDHDEAVRLRDKGYSLTAIGEKMGKNESSIRDLLNPVLYERSQLTATTADVIKKFVDDNGPVDIGEGVENHLGISSTRLKSAVALLEDEGYQVMTFQHEQLGNPGKYTRLKVLAPPDVEYKDVSRNRAQIKAFGIYSEDQGRSWAGIEPVNHIDSKRILVKYHEDGGTLKDGVIELRKGVPDISLGHARYAQVRIGLDGTHFMKGMAIYSDDIPAGKDIIYNTNKPRGTAKDDVFKPLKADPGNPFGAVIRQKHYIDADGKERLSALNIVGSKEGAGEEGSWDEWSRSISSQVLSKQSVALARRQLQSAHDIKRAEFDEIMSLTNPVIKKKLLQSFADDADASAVHLKAAALPRQGSHVLLPITKMKETEIYAPNFEDGELVVLIRHPHGGIFEIPELRVNNRNPSAKSIMGGAKDAVGIHPTVAAKLSGADFDGDAVIVIPNKNRDIQTSATLRGLKDFEPRILYKDDSLPKMTTKTKGRLMGDVSNLITDMTIQGAPEEQIVRAVRHSMVVIDAEKHNLDYKRSFNDHNIAALKREYQGGTTRGAATLISKSKSDFRVDHRKPGIGIDPETGRKAVGFDPVSGKKIWAPTGKTYFPLVPDRNGPFEKDPITGKKRYLNKVRSTTPMPRKIISTKMAETDDARKLSSGSVMEGVYSDYANSMKSMANEARRALFNTEGTHYSPSARRTYEREVASLKSKLWMSDRHKPVERQAQLLGNANVVKRRQANPDMTPEELKKIKGQALQDARARLGGGKKKILITDREWEAIQAGAISENSLMKILNNTDVDALKQRAMPRIHKVMSPAKESRARTMLDAGYTRAEIATALGVSVSSLNEVIK